MTHILAFRGRCFLSSRTSVVSLLCFSKATSQLSFLLLFPLVDDKVQNFSSLSRQSCVIFHLLPLNSFHPLLRDGFTLSQGKKACKIQAQGRDTTCIPGGTPQLSACEPGEHTRQLKATYVIGPGQHFLSHSFLFYHTAL